ncbi:MAG: DHH family phosphoesterase [Anaerolineales bacterium]|nr:DHH family phosphoesterase [Anaerolineales bacterium]
MDRIYVIGHVNPDTDSIASAVGYAWLLRERDGDDVVAARAGPVNPQTSWVLKRLGLEAPALLTDASPRFESVTRRLDTAAPDDLLQDAWAILNRTGGTAPLVNPDDGKPVGMITGLSLFNLMARHVGAHPRRQSMRISEILDFPCREACDSSVPRFQISVHIRDMLVRVLREEHNDFLIVDEQGLYAGVTRKQDVLNPPRLRLILVDHNEPGQSLGAIEEAELIEILDHHRLGNQSTRAPIRFSVDVVGSTSTLVSERIEEAGLSAPPNIAGLLLAGLLSDTLILTSPTTTPRDHLAAERLGRWAFVRNGPLAGEKLQSYGEQVIEAGAGLSTRDPFDIVSTDIKTYESGGHHFAISQVEVTDLRQLDEHLDELRQALVRLRQERQLDFATLMVTDVVDNTSSLLTVNSPPLLDDLPYPKQQDGTLLASGVVSRKKQLLPVMLSLLEE